MSPEFSSNATKLANAGLVSLDNLSDEDHEVIAQLSVHEVTTLIAIATRLYADNPSVLKELNLATGLIRIMVPL